MWMDQEPEILELPSTISQVMSPSLSQTQILSKPLSPLITHCSPIGQPTNDGARPHIRPPPLRSILIHQPHPRLRHVPSPSLKPPLHVPPVGNNISPWHHWREASQEGELVRFVIRVSAVGGGQERATELEEMKLEFSMKLEMSRWYCFLSDEFGDDREVERRG